MTKKHFSSLTLLAVAASLSTGAFAAQVTLEISTGDPLGNYYGFVNEASKLCSNEAYKVTPVASSGSPQNIDRVMANETAGGVIQGDVGNLVALSKDISDLRVLLPLYPELAHFITRASLGQTEAATFNGIKLQAFGWKPGAKEVVLNNVADLQGRTVAAAGGSFYTGEVLRHPNVGNLQFKLVELTGPTASSEVVKGVLSGQYDAGLLVSSQPTKVLTGMGDGITQLKFLPVPDDILGRLVKFYPTKDLLSYRAMGQNGTNIQTFQVMSMLVVQNYTKGPYAAALSDFRKCILENAETQSSIPKTNLAWKFIAKNANSTMKFGSWQVWEEPKSAAGQSVKVPAKK